MVGVKHCMTTQSSGTARQGSCSSSSMRLCVSSGDDGAVRAWEKRGAAIGTWLDLLASPRGSFAKTIHALKTSCARRYAAYCHSRASRPRRASFTSHPSGRFPRDNEIWGD
eukprot:2806780-Pleurochrysis_carterae.AAC.3